MTVLSGNDNEARREALHVPLERPGQRLVEIAHRESQIAFGGRPQAEVQDMSVATHLDDEPRVGAAGNIGSHHGSGPAEVGPGGG